MSRRSGGSRRSREAEGAASPLYQPEPADEPADPPPRRRSRTGTPAPEMPSGWRTSRRGSGAIKKARRDTRVHEVRERVGTTARRFTRGAGHVTYLIGVAFAGVVAVVIAALLLSLAVNGVARWNAKRVAHLATTPEARAEQARDNLLIVALDDSGRASGFLAIRIDGKTKSIYGIAIPDGAFIEVPGQGFERIGASWDAGPDVSLDAVSNFFGVPFRSYAQVSSAAYQAALTDQSLAGISLSSTDSNLDEGAAADFSAAFAQIATENVALVPMPVKPITLGNQTYFEPQRDQIADLVETWWGVRIDAEQMPTRIIVYNGAGTPGIAGIAAQALIRGGLRVVDTKNADRFDYEITKIIVQSGPIEPGQEVAEILGVGEVLEQVADQQIADVIVIIGKDYTPPAQP
ncbi:MAG: LCP family protein [Coriobacteriia bacterium]|nr:LCP family protein [Coriobacteriia bacterium]